jgi:hypothetical protein
MAMEGALVVTVDYEYVWQHTMAENVAMFKSIFGWVVVNSNTILLHLNIFGVIEIVGILTSLEL